MRALVRLEDEDRAKTLGDALFAEGIDNRVETSREGGYLVWVHDELQMDAAKRVLAAYEESPDDPRFERARRVASARRREKEAEAKKKTRHRTVDVRKRWRSQSAWGRLTLGLIIVSVAVTLLAGTLFPGSGENLQITGRIMFDWRQILTQFEVWRILTPIFLHLGFLHLIFNMWWLKDFGAFIEMRHGTLMLLAMVVVIGSLSNLAQAYLSNPNFGGMSGVIYGLFGYLWIRGRLDPGFGVSIPRSTVIILIGWMALGFFGFFRMANIAHLGGLVVGMAWAAIAALRARRRR